MIVDEIAEKIFQMQKAFFERHEIRPDKEPAFAIYVDQETFCLIRGELKSPMSAVAFEFATEQKILGQPVHRVIGNEHSWRVFES